jgi:hypothetical protein
MKSLNEKLGSTQFDKQASRIWLQLQRITYMGEEKYRGAMYQIVYDIGRSLTLTKKTSEPG